MAITFAQQKRKQQYLLLVVGGLVVAALIVLWLGFLKPVPQASLQNQEPIKPPDVRIDFDVLQDSFLMEAEVFPAIPPLATGVPLGRQEPFSPYQPAK